MKRRGAWLRGLAWAATLLVALWILSLTLVEREQPGSINLTPFSRKLPALACLRGGCELPDERNAAAIFLLVDVLGNIAVFVPFGMALAAATFPRRRRGQRGRHFGGRWWGRVLLAGFLFSLSIEVGIILSEFSFVTFEHLLLHSKSIENFLSLLHFYVKFSEVFLFLLYLIILILYFHFECQFFGLQSSFRVFKFIDIIEKSVNEVLIVFCHTVSHFDLRHDAVEIGSTEYNRSEVIVAVYVHIAKTAFKELDIMVDSVLLFDYRLV